MTSINRPGIFRRFFDMICYYSATCDGISGARNFEYLRAGQKKEQPNTATISEVIEMRAAEKAAL